MVKGYDKREQVDQTSLISGIMIGIGVIANSTIENKYIGAMLFSLALLSIIKGGFQLYTGRIGYIVDRRHSVLSYISMFVGNFMGIVTTVFLWFFTDNEEVQIKMEELAEAKFSKTYMAMFVGGLLCGVLMMIAVYMKDTIITIFCIMTFILCGFEHCIADIPFWYLSFLSPELSGLESTIKLFLVIIGNSVGAILIYADIKLAKYYKTINENH